MYQVTLLLYLAVPKPARTMSIAAIIYYIFIASFSIQVFHWLGFSDQSSTKDQTKEKRTNQSPSQSVPGTN